MSNHKPAKASPYNLDIWGEGYVSVNDEGELMLQPHRNPEQSIRVLDLLSAIKSAGLRTPTLVRLKDILHDRVNNLVSAFNVTTTALDYSGKYTVVYPIKVNQQRRVVEEIIKSEPARSQQQVGLEAGSKPEFLAVLALSLEPGSVIVCNGYKDAEYIRMALMGQALGYEVFIVVEKLSELELIVKESNALGVAPNIGIRARLSTIGKGKWQNTGGEKSKFGLSSSQILEAIEYLDAQGLKSRLTLLHFHLGSQIANIRDIHGGLQECARIYSQLSEIGCEIHTVDIGGGLGVDYDGTRSRNSCSINYQLKDYAHSVVSAFQEECNKHDLRHPNIISESGRAITAHHAILLADVVASEVPKAICPSKTDHISNSSHAAIQHLWEDYVALTSNTNARSIVEIYHDAAHVIKDIYNQFVLGTLTLKQKSEAEEIYNAICLSLKSQLSPGNRDHRDILDDLNEKLAEKLFVNFSVFQSLPDVWGIDQIFPILPVEKINDRLDRHVVIQDITCDSDGRIDHYVSSEGIQNTLQLPCSNKDQENLCFFMVGAYQEILGDMHNLFGDTDSVDVSLDENGQLHLAHEIRGDTISSVLEYVNLTPEYLMKNYRQLLESQHYTEDQQANYLRAFEQGLESYTYLSR